MLLPVVAFDGGERHEVGLTALSRSPCSTVFEDSLTCCIPDARRPVADPRTDRSIRFNRIIRGIDTKLLLKKQRMRRDCAQALKPLAAKPLARIIAAGADDIRQNRFYIITVK
jgi:hypothetical protein